MGRGPRRRRRGLLLIVGVAVIVLVTVRAAPKLIVRLALARKLSAEVRLDAIRFESLSKVRIEGLRLRRIASEPRIEELSVTALIANGRLADMADGRFDSIRAEGLRLRLEPAEPPPVVEGPGATVQIGRIELPDAVITLKDGVAPITLDADLSLSGGFPSGTLHLGSSVLEAESIARLLRVKGPAAANRTILTGLDISLELPDGSPGRQAGRPQRAEGDGRGRLLASLDNVVSPESGMVLPGIAVSASIDLRDGHAAIITARGRLPFAQDLWLNGLVTPDGIERLDGTLCGVDAASLGLLFGLEAAGRFDLDAWTKPDGRILVGIDALLSSLKGPSGTMLEGIAGRLQGEIPSAAGDAPLHGALALDRVVARSDLPVSIEAVTPLTMGFDGRLSRSGMEGRLSLAGGDSLVATMEGRLSIPGLKPEGSLCAEATLDLEGAAPALPIDGRASFEGTIASLAPPEAWGRISIEDGQVALPGLAALPIAASCEVQVAGFNARFDRLDAHGRFSGYGGIPVTLSGSGILGADMILLSPVRLEALDGTSLDATIAVAGGGIQGTAAMESTNPGDWIAAMTDTPYVVSGKASASIRLRSEPDGGASASCLVRATGGFSSEDGAEAAEGLGAEASLIVTKGGGEGISIIGDSDQTGFQLLWGAFYGDFSSVRSHLSFSARTDRGSISRVAGILSIPEGPELSLALARNQAWHYRGRLAIEDLSGLLSKYQEKLAESYEPLASVTAHGSLTMDGEGILAGASSTLSGRVLLRDAGFGLPGVVVPKCALDLPFGVDFEDPSGGEPMRGRVSFESLTVHGLKILGATSPVTTAGDSLTIERPLTVPMATGTIVLGRVRLQHLLEPTRSLVTRLSLSDLDIGSLAKSLGLPPFEGTMNGDFETVRVAANRLKVAGGGALDLFGGRVEIQDISGRDIFSRYPRIRFRAKFHGIDLLELTRTFDFGEMSGVLEGEVRHLELFRGVPMAMDAEFHTVKRQGVARTINVKAIKNIAILGSGSGTNVFDAGIHKLFDRYTYERLGVTMKLANDVFLLRGEEHRGGKELFLKGRLPLRIDVRNMSPGQTVSFSTMIERIKTLDVGGVKIGR